MKHLTLQILFVLFTISFVQCSVVRTGATSTLQAPDTIAQQEWKTHYTTAVPPEEWQNGGEEFFGPLKSVAEMYPDYDGYLVDRTFYNQIIDLDKLGPGSNVLLVTNGKQWVFAISNGRFEGTETVGRLSDKSYPFAKLVEKEGKYPWPQDDKGRWLPGRLLAQSNRPHGSLQTTLSAITKDRDRSLMMGAHVGVSKDGSTYIGYVSGSASANSGGNDFANSLDRRALPLNLRGSLHAVLRSACKGRDIAKVVDSAPESEEEIKAGRASTELQRRRVQFHPATSGQISIAQTTRTPETLLRAAIGDREARKYLSDAVSLSPNAVVWAALYERREMVQQVIAQGGDLDVLVQLSWLLEVSPLMSAARNGYLGIASDLINAGAKVDLQNSSRESALHMACDVGNVDMVKLLLDAGANVDLQDRRSHSALALVAKRDERGAFSETSLELAKILIEAGANLNLGDYNGNTPLMNALNRGNTQLALALVEAGADLNIRSGDGSTALICASSNSINIPVIKEMVKRGANPNHVDSQGHSALTHTARYRNDDKMLRALIEAGAKVEYTGEESADERIRAAVSAVGKSAPLPIDSFRLMDKDMCSAFREKVDVRGVDP